MMPTRAQLKADAKSAMKNGKTSIYLITFLMMLITWVLNILTVKISFPDTTLWSVVSGIFYDGMPGTVGAAANSSSLTRTLLQLAIQVMILMMDIGFTIVCLKFSRGIAAGVGELFDGFGMFFKFIWLEILMGIFISLWVIVFFIPVSIIRMKYDAPILSLLVVLSFIPGIIAQYRYRMAVYIQIDNPEYSAMECIRQSKKMMSGHKLELWVLDLSFILWNLLSLIPFVSIYVEPYMAITCSNYYCALSGRTGNEGFSSDEPSSGSSWEGRDPWDK